jgi:hypothetical protein
MSGEELHAGVLEDRLNIAFKQQDRETSVTAFYILRLTPFSSFL